MNEHIQKMLDIANSGYENGECQINTEIDSSHRGDGLASFIRTEIIEACDGLDDLDDVQIRTLNVIHTAITQLEEVYSALYLHRYDSNAS